MGAAGRMVRQEGMTADRATAIEIDSVSKVFVDRKGSRNEVLRDIGLTIAENEFVSLVGRSGCGKTTLLNIMAGLERATNGVVRISGREIRGPGEGQGMVFQQHALFPWLTARGNVVFGLRNAGISKAEKRDRADELLELVGLTAAASRYPREMSGGMQQRVAIARALALDPEILLMDEPFGALDEMTRIELQDELLRIWETRKKTIVFVTHSINEALVLSDRIVLMLPNAGGIARDIHVDLCRPRQRTDPRFAAMYEDIWQGLSG